jgi:replicative DNA helicase
MAVLGALLLDKEALLKAVELLRREHFYKEAHARTFEACLALFDRSEPVDLVTLSNELRRRQCLEAVGGEAYLTQLVDGVVTAANVAHHAQIVREKFILRELIRVADDVKARAFAQQDQADELLDAAEGCLFHLSQDRVTRAFVRLGEMLKDTFTVIERLHERDVHVTGVATGFPRFDEMTAGLQPSDLVVIAGRPSTGKTSFCLNLAQHVAIQERQRVAIFSLEMSMEQLVQRMLCSEARVDLHRVRTGRLDPPHWPKLTAAAGRLSEAPIFIDDTPAISVLEMRAKARRLKNEPGGLALVVVDYLQLVRARGRHDNRQQEISEISRSLKAMAKELALPVVALSQLSRAIEVRGGPPQLSDLRESGAIEQDADLVAFIYRAGLEHARREKRAPTVEEERQAEVVIEKQRNGPTGTIKLVFNREYTRFDNRADREE